MLSPTNQLTLLVQISSLGKVYLCELRVPVSPFPPAVSCRVIGPTVSEYYGLIRLPARLRLSYLMFRFGLPVFQ